MNLKSRLLATSLSVSVIGLISIATSTELEAAPRDHQKKPLTVQKRIKPSPKTVQKRIKPSPKAVIHRGNPARTVSPNRVL